MSDFEKVHGALSFVVFTLHFCSSNSNVRRKQSSILFQMNNLQNECMKGRQSRKLCKCYKVSANNSCKCYKVSAKQLLPQDTKHESLRANHSDGEGRLQRREKCMNAKKKRAFTYRYARPIKSEKIPRHQAIQ